MALIFNSISQFVIQPERTKKRVKRDDLDMLTEVWTGPTDQEDTFVPRNGAVHPFFNLMTVINTAIKRMPALVSEVTINYQGKLDSSGQSFYSSVPTISLSWMEGEVSYQTLTTTQVRVPTGSGSFFTYPDPGVSTYSRRYTGRCCQVAYITNQRPTGNPTNIGLADDFLGFTNVWETLSNFQAGTEFQIQGTPIEQMTCTDVKVEDKADGWYRVTETYQSRQFPGAAIKEPGIAAIGVSTNLVDNSVPGSNFSFSSSAALQAAQRAGYSELPSSTNINAVKGAQQTGIDQAWGSVPQAIPAATAAARTDVVTLANGSTVLDY